MRWGRQEEGNWEETAGGVVNKNPAERPYLPPTEKNNKGWKRLAWRRKLPSQGDHHLGCPLCSTQQPPPSRAVPLSNGPQWQSQGVAATKKSGQAHRSSGKTYTVPVVLRMRMDTREGTVIISHGISTFPPSFLGSHHPSSMSPPHHPMQFNAIDPVHVNSGFQLLGSYSIASSGTLYFRHFTSVLHDVFACLPRSSLASAVSSTGSRGFQFVHCSRWQGGVPGPRSIGGPLV